MPTLNPNGIPILSSLIFILSLKFLINCHKKGGRGPIAVLQRCKRIQHKKFKFKYNKLDSIRFGWFFKIINECSSSNMINLIQFDLNRLHISSDTNICLVR